MKRLRSWIADAAPLAGLILFQGIIGVTVARIDAQNGLGPINALYAVFVQCAAGVVYLAVRSALRALERGELEKAALDPLNSELPAARGESASVWKSFSLAQRREAVRILSEREASAASDMDAFVASIHAMKAPAAALGLMADRAERTGIPIDPSDLKLEAEELDRLLELALGRIRLADFERDTFIEPVELCELASRSIRRCRRFFIARGISVDLSDHTTLVETDRKWIGFILDQLVVNAAKYASSSVTVTVSRGGEAAELSVTDDGPGIRPEDHDRLSTRSFVGSTGRAADASGTPSSGYGLYLAFRAAEKLGVRVGLENAGSAGTIATISIPAERHRFE